MGFHWAARGVCTTAQAYAAQRWTVPPCGCRAAMRANAWREALGEPAKRGELFDAENSTMKQADHRMRDANDECHALESVKSLFVSGTYLAVLREIAGRSAA
jgi:hypothetical protein